jgi:phosphoglucomutase/phosphomannomutase
MLNSTTLIEITKNGFNTLSISKKYIDSAIHFLKIWLTDDQFRDYVPQILYLIETKKWDFLLDSFYQIIPFGTGGRRGMVGIGPNRINTWTIQASAQGHSQYLIKQYGDDAKSRGVILAYDVRKYAQKGIYNDDIPNPVMNLDCKQLAISAAEVYTANDIKIIMFEDYRSTPELSFAIRHINAIAGNMFSASHNPPTDNGKKVYDQFGGQLIPPEDQHLVDEVINKVEKIKRMDFDLAQKNGRVSFIGKEIDKAYLEKVCALSLSPERNIRILYSPMHGTGMTSVYPALQRLGFDIVLDPKTKYYNGAFENITFNIPNPEVMESFNHLMPTGDEVQADILLTSDPDADRLGVMAKHNNKWYFLNGHELSIILTHYGISKFKQQGMLTPEKVIIRTNVTTSLVTDIARKHHIRCIDNLLVGFKYIGDELNKLEQENKIHHFIIGTEESHGFIMGNYVRDKDAATAGIWLSELAAALKNENKTLIDYLNEIFSEYGYCNNLLTEIRLLGSSGMEKISTIMNYMRNHHIDRFGEFKVKEKDDFWSEKYPPFLSATDKSSRNVLVFHLETQSNLKGLKVTLRPSGTEPKLKIYIEVFGKQFDMKYIDQEKRRINQIRENLEKSFMLYCYKIINVEFPDRGFLLFWQLPLLDKLKYFEIEEQIVNLKEIVDKNKRKNDLFNLLGFLGSNPIEKINNAFEKKYAVGVLQYLDLNDR